MAKKTIIFSPREKVLFQAAGTKQVDRQQQMARLQGEGLPQGH